MKLLEVLQPKIVSGSNDQTPQDLVPQDVVGETCVSAIAEGISRILRRQKGKGLKTGFRCTSGPRKGRIVANPETCFARLQPVKGAKIAQKRQARAKQTAKKRARTMKSGGASRRLQKIQIDKSRKGSAPLKRAGRLQKSRVIKPKKR